MIEQIVLYVISFIGFLFIQSLVINGVHESMKGGAIRDDTKGTEVYQGQIIYILFPKFFEKYKYKYWAKSLFTCVRCMASSHGAWTYWPVVIYLFGFHAEEIFVFVLDVFALSSINWWIYKKL